MVALIRTSLMLLLLFMILTGVLYPIAVTGIAHGVFPQQATGSIIVKNGKAVGSRLIGQQFDDPKYFWGRLSATSPYPYNGAASTGSNLGPTNPNLTAAAEGRIKALREAEPGNTSKIPVDLVTASGSGLDPHISPAAAEYQLHRVAMARGIDDAAVRALVAQHTQEKRLGIIGEPVVNVLALNIALDER
jgi:K+-transporting ATPase ATPase C chain